MEASIGSHFDNIKLQYLQKYESIFIKFASKRAALHKLLDTIQLYFCVPFPLIKTPSSPATFVEIGHSLPVVNGWWMCTKYRSKPVQEKCG